MLFVRGNYEAENDNSYISKTKKLKHKLTQTASDNKTVDDFHKKVNINSTTCSAILAKLHNSILTQLCG